MTKTNSRQLQKATIASERVYSSHNYRTTPTLTFVLYTEMYIDRLCISVTILEPTTLAAPYNLKLGVKNKVRGFRMEAEVVGALI
jgi:hypothetical protein